MRAAVLPEPGSAENFVIKEVAVPVPGPTDVLIKVQYCGVDGHDLAVRSGLMRRSFKSGIILGHEVSGTVVEVGSLVSTVKPNDRVCNRTTLPCGLCRYCGMGEDTLCVSGGFGHGGLAEYVLYPEDSVIPVPDGVDMVDAAVTACAIATPYRALAEVAQVKPGEVVLVTGAGGGLGVHTVQLVHLFGARAIGWTRTESKRAVLESVGVDELICGETESTPVWQRLLDLTEGWGVDVVIDNVGSAVFNDAFRGMAQLGRYIMLGEVLGNQIHINPGFIFFKRAKILGCGPHMRADVFKALELVRGEKIKPIIGGIYSLEQIGEVHALLEEGVIAGRAVVEL